MGFSFMVGEMNPSYAEGEYAWVLVDTYRSPLDKRMNVNDGGYYIYTGKFEGNTLELRTRTRDPYTPADFHAIYTWTNPPSIIKSKEDVTIRLEQEVINNNQGNLNMNYSPYFRQDQGKSAKGVYKDGKPLVNLRLAK